jgi:DNA-3-methyladenine glycosylase II
MAPQRFLERGDAGLRALGLTRQKSAYCLAAARAVADGTLDLPALRRMGDEEARAALMRLKGIGRWSADIYLLMALRRPDVWPCGDLALETTLKRLGKVRGRPSPERLEALAERWRPWRAVAARMLWQRYLAGEDA